MNVDRLIAVLATDKAFGGTDEHLTATEIANILWLARQIQSEPVAQATPEPKPPEVVEQQLDGSTVLELPESSQPARSTVSELLESSQPARSTVSELPESPQPEHPTVPELPESPQPKHPTVPELPESPQPEHPTVPELPESPQPEHPTVPELPESPQPEPAAPEPTIEIATASPSPGILPQKALPIWVPDPPLLGDSLGLMRSLRSILQKVPSGVACRLDEAATVDRIAETDIWSPILEAEREPWFEVALIVDRSASMNLWQRLADDLELALKHYGAFRDVRSWDLDADGGTVKLRSRIGAKYEGRGVNKPLSASGRGLERGLNSLPEMSDNSQFNPENNNPNASPSEDTEPEVEYPARSPRELVATDGRRIAIVLSDCVADYWWAGTMGSVLQEWAEAMPTVVWQVLPQWMWERTALGIGEAVAVRNAVPGAANGQLESEVLSRLSDSSEPGTILPVITSELKDVKAWSRMLAGDRRQVSAGVSMPLNLEPNSETVGEFPMPEAQENDDEIQAQSKIQQFRMLSSPRARQLVALLAAAPVITLPVMRLIRASMLPEASPLPVAEVFLSGLLRRLPQQPPDTDPELVQYDFVPGVREALLDRLPQVDAIEVIEAVSSYVSRRLGYSSLQQFKAFLLSPEAERGEDLRGLRAFATVTATILKRLGGQYAEMAREFEVLPSDEQQTDSEAPEFPELETYEFETATISSETVERRTGFLGLGKKQIERQLTIQRSRGTAWQFVEDLGNGVELAMVSIPGGSFMMGSPDKEPESHDDEKPQHEVNVPPFYLGKYPVTQAQWRAVAALPPVERELKPEPSHFEGENLPVECVLWFDAIEFCQRLSIATGREYRLPSEAEWEYACRAGTETPFYFGETITTELANYNGNYTYNNGPKGEYRKKTTEAGSFPANAWGLYDLHGNLWEWCLDDWHGNYEGAPTDGSAWRAKYNLTTKSTGSNITKVLRGGSWYFLPRTCRSACRLISGPAGDINLDFGFRVACVSP